MKIIFLQLLIFYYLSDRISLIFLSDSLFKKKSSITYFFFFLSFLLGFFFLFPSSYLCFLSPFFFSFFLRGPCFSPLHMFLRFSLTYKHCLCCSFSILTCHCNFLLHAYLKCQVLLGDLYLTLRHEESAQNILHYTLAPLPHY